MKSDELAYLGVAFNFFSKSRNFCDFITFAKVSSHLAITSFDKPLGPAKPKNIAGDKGYPSSAKVLTLGADGLRSGVDSAIILILPEANGAAKSYMTAISIVLPNRAAKAFAPPLNGT